MLAVLPLWLANGAAQQGGGRERDAGTFAVTVNGAAAGREEFTIREGRAATRNGFTVTARRFSEDGGDPTLLTTTELGPDSQPLTAQLAAPASQRRTYIQVSPRRVTTRAVDPFGESVREYRGGSPLWLADDSVLTWFALPPRVGVPSIIVVWPRQDRREVLDLTDRGVEPTAAGPDSRSLRHVVLGTGPGERHLWYDERGRLTRVEVPASGLVAVRSTP